jgi:hypothetical protein
MRVTETACAGYADTCRIEQLENNLKIQRKGKSIAQRKKPFGAKTRRRNQAAENIVCQSRARVNCCFVKTSLIRAAWFTAGVLPLRGRRLIISR